MKFSLNKVEVISVGKLGNPSSTGGGGVMFDVDMPETAVNSFFAEGKDSRIKRKSSIDGGSNDAPSPANTPPRKHKVSHQSQSASHHSHHKEQKSHKKVKIVEPSIAELLGKKNIEES